MMKKIWYKLSSLKRERCEDYAPGGGGGVCAAYDHIKAPVCPRKLEIANNKLWCGAVPKTDILGCVYI